MKQKRLIDFVCLFACITLMSTSCKKDWLNVKSDIKLSVPSTLQEFEYLLNDYSTMNQESAGLAEVGSDNRFVTEARWALSSFRDVERNAYTWSNSLPYVLINDWDLSYKRIFQCNFILDGLKNLSPSIDSERYNQIRGNALFFRAKNYYDLAQIYAQPYQESSATTDVGIPLKEGVDITEPSKRASVKATYERILTDLRTAVSFLPNLPELQQTKGSKTAGFALLARTYLTMGDYLNAGLYADSSLRLYNKLIDFNTISPTATNLGIFNKETLFYTQRVVYISIFPSSASGVNPELYALYSNDDLRKTRFFSSSADRIIFKGNYNNSAAGFDGLAVDEQYLIRAECFARAGNVVAAMKDLNDLLKTRWNNAVTYPLRTAIDAEDALRQVLVERRKELLFRNLRWTDLRRLNLDPRFKTTLTRTIGGKTYTLEPNSYKYTLPIPDNVMNLAPQMKQSPGW